MNFAEMMAARRSCRAYQDKAVAREDLVKIVEAGRLTPSACNSQPWKFIVVDEPAAKELLCDALVIGEGKTACPWRAQVPAFIVVCETEAKVMPFVLEHYKTTQYYAPGDLGAAAMNMCHQAMELGLSTCILGLNDQEKMERHFGIPAGHTVRVILAVGYGVEPAAAPNKVRKPLEEVCSFNRW